MIRERKKSLAIRIVFIVAVFTFPVNLFMAYYAKQSQNIILKDAKMSIVSMADIYLNEIENDIQSLNTFMMNLEEADADLPKLLGSQGWDDYFIAAMGLRNTMNKQLTVRGDADCYFFYFPQMEHGMLVEKSVQFTQKQLVDRCLGSMREQIFSTKNWQILMIDNTKWLFHVIQYKSLYLGAGIQLDTLEKQFEEALLYQGAVVRFEKEDVGIREAGTEYIVQPSAKKQFCLQIQVPQESIVQNLPILQRWGYWIAIAELFMIPILILLIFYYVLKPLNVLKMAIDKLKQDPNARITAKADSAEFNYVYDSFNHMADEIMQMKFDSYEQKMEQQRITMKNLQLQVKPHFLFNSFNLMYNLVQMGEYKSAQKMILYLSDYFHYINIGKNDFSRFGDEFNLIQMYLEVSEIRYPDIFEVLYDVSEEAKEVFVPQMLIHNFVENIIKHGLELTRKNHIVVQAYVRKGEAVFRVEDDGRGMPEEEVQAINSGQFHYPDGKNHQGVRNSFDRMNFFYGDKGHIYFESEAGRGTIVAITMPLEAVQEESK